MLSPLKTMRVYFGEKYWKDLRIKFEYSFSFPIREKFLPIYLNWSDKMMI